MMIEIARQDKRWSSTGVLHCDTGYLALCKGGLEKMLVVDDLIPQMYARNYRSMLKYKCPHGVLYAMFSMLRLF